MDSAIIGKYSSDRLVVTEFNIDRTNVRTIQSGIKRKAVGHAKQSVSISLSGYLICTSFAELEIEKDRLLNALNETEIKLVIGHRPNVYWLVSWSDSDLAHKAKNGGYVLPISLNFDCLESSAVNGIPGSKGYVKLDSQFIDSSGNIFEDGHASQPSAILFSPTTLTATAQTALTVGIYAIEVSKDAAYAVATLKANGVVTAALSSPVKSSNVFGISFSDSYVALHVDGFRKVVGDSSAKPTYTMNADSGKLWELELDFLPLGNYSAEVIALSSASSIIEVRTVSNGQQVVNLGSAPAPASLIINASGHSTASVNRFGVSSTQNQGKLVLNGIDASVETFPANDLITVEYLSGFSTLLPYLETGVNTFNASGNGKFILAWHKRYY